MTKEIIIIALVIALIYFYYQNRPKPNLLTETTSLDNELDELKKSLDKLIEKNEDYETEVDTLTRTKNSLEQDLLAQSNAFQSRLKEKDRENKKLKEDLTNEKKRADNIQQKLTSEKQMSKGNIERITKLTEQITNLEKELKKMPGEFPTEDKIELTKEHQEQLRKINLLFDEKAQDYPTIDFNGLYTLLETIAQEQKKKKNNRGTSTNIQSTEKTKKTLEEFMKWIEQDEERKEILAGIDWNFYHSKKDWLTSFKKWNTLRTDRLELLEEWLNKD